MKVTFQILICILSAFALGLPSCRPSNVTVIRKKVMVEGIALDEKNGAIVLTNAKIENGEIVHTGEGDIYFIKGLDSWEDEEYGKPVSVTGRGLRIIKLATTYLGPDSMAIQQTFGTKAIILKPKWKFIDR